MPLDQIDIDKIDPHTGQLLDREKEMSFLDHLEELRWHIIRSLVAVVVVGIAIFVGGDWIFHHIIEAPGKRDFIFYRLVCQLSNSIGLGDAMCFGPNPFQLQATGFAEVFISHLKIAFFGGVIVAFPYIFWEFWRFVAPGLYDKERKAARGIVFVCSFLFLLGTLFGYFVIAPFAVTFLSSYQLGDVIYQPTISSYVDAITMIVLPAGISFELPVVVFFMSKAGLITADFLRQYRRHSIIVILILAAIITPPDMITQCLIGIPLFVLYEISIVIAKRVERQREE